MRKISPTQILVFLGLFALILGLAVATTTLVMDSVPTGDFRGIIVFGIGMLIFYFFSIVVYRVFLFFFPLQPGEVKEKSNQEFVYHVYILFYLLLFYPIMRSGFIPAPMMRIFYLALGARLGENTYSQGIIHDPSFVEIGKNSVVGQYAILVPHVIEGTRLAHYPIRIGNNVTIGAHASVLSDVEIGDGAIVATGAVVRKGTRIGPGEHWGGVPARRIHEAHPHTAHAKEPLIN